MKVNIKTFLTALILLIFVGNNYAQKGIGTNNPEPSSVLDLTSTTKGLLIPRMTTLQRINLPSPAEGLQVYDINTHTHWFYNGSIWTESNLWAKSGTTISPALSGDDLLLNTGSTLSIADMTQGSVPFIGASGLVTQNNSNLFWNAANNRLGVGINSPSRTLDINGNALVRNTVTIHTKETYEEKFLNVKLYWNLLQTEETTHDPNIEKFATITSGTGLEQIFPLTRWKMGDEAHYGTRLGYVGYLPGKYEDFRINTAGKGSGLVLGTQLKDVIYIKPSGRVGFNTDSPKRLVHIAGDMQLDEHFFDEKGQPGNPGDLLSSTHTGTEWIDAHSVGTDDQNISGSGLSGTTLTIGIENGTSETVDLSSLQDGTGTDDQTVDKFNLNGTTLELSLEDDGVADNTVDLSSLQDGTGTDDQTVDKFNLNGTTLELSLEDDGVVDNTVDLSSLQDGTGTDDQNISGSGLSGTILTIGIENGTSETVDLSSLSTNIFNTNGTLTSNRTLTGGGNSLAFTGLSGFGATTDAGQFQLGTDAKWTDARAAGNQTGIEYAADYSADFTNRSLVDRQYVDDAVVASSITASNGLTRIGNDIRIGGSLSANTDINAGSHKFSVTGTDGTYINSLLIDRFYNMLRTDDPSGGWGVVSSCNTGSYMQAYDGANEQRIMLHKTAGISVRDDIDHRGLLYIEDYSANYTNRSLVDKEYVDNAVATGGTDDQNISGSGLSGTTLTIGIENGTSETVDLSTLTHTGTTGSIFFAGTNGKPTENNSQLFWDAANNRLGLGTTTPTHKFQVVGQVRATSMANASGTAGSPAYRFNDDANTGLFRPAADQLGVSTGGTEAFRIDASQNMGIGTTTPDYKLQVNGTIAPETTDQDLGTSTLKWDAHLNDVEADKVTTNEMTINDLLVAPKLTSAPASPTAGQIYYDTTDNKLRCYDGTNWKDLF